MKMAGKELTMAALEAAVKAYCDATKGAAYQPVKDGNQDQFKILVNGDPERFVWLEEGKLKSSDESLFWNIAEYLRGKPAESPRIEDQPVKAPIIPPATQKPRVEPLVKPPSGFRKAERRKAKLRLGITGPAGSGKTMSALLIAGGLVNGDYSKIGIVDTENGSADLYVHNTASGAEIGEYNVMTLSPPFEASKYINAIKMAEDCGLEVVVLDSITHAWSGEGGFLDKQGKIADKSGNSWTAWRSVTPEHNRFIDAMLQSKIHVIATMRSKTEHVYEGGKVKKLGMAPVAREGMEYEFSVVFDMDQSHNATPTKDRTSLFDGKIFKPTSDTGKTLLKWLEVRV
jgi:hypothetical protein